MGSTVDTVVSSGPPGFPTKSPNWALAMPAMPSMGEVILVKLRSISDLRTAALAACTAALAEASRPMASSRSFLLTAFTAARGRFFPDWPCSCRDWPSSLANSPFGLLQGRLEGPGVDLKEDLALLHHGAFLIVLLDEITLDLGVDLGVHQAVGGPHPLPHDGHVLDDHLRHFHGGSGRAGRLLSRRSPLGETQKSRLPPPEEPEPIFGEAKHYGADS